MKKAIVYLSMTAGLWLLLLGNDSDGYISTGKWFRTENNCRIVGGKLNGQKNIYLCVKSTPTQ
jgi:hypothetical protein